MRCACRTIEPRSGARASKKARRTRAFLQRNDTVEQGLAEREGFEPSIRDKRIHAFQACAFNHSATSPEGRASYTSGSARRNCARRASLRFFTRMMRRHSGVVSGLPRTPHRFPTLRHPKRAPFGSMHSRVSASIHVKDAPHTPCAACPVRKRALFEQVATEHLDWTQRFRSNQVCVEAKHDVLREGETAEYFYTLFSGWMILYKSLPSGKRQIVRIALPGDLVGFQPVLQAPLGYSAQTLTPVELCAFPRADLAHMLAARPELAIRLALMNAQDMALCHSHLLGMGRKSAKERVAFFLLEMWRRVRAMGELMPSHADGGIDFPIAQEEIADAVGLTTVHVNRTLKELRDAGLATSSQRRLTIHDEPALEALAEFDARALLDHARL